ncbi:type II secretion system protein [Pseudomonas sp. HK3]
MTKNSFYKNNQIGFTLIELIIVIVVLSILAIGSVQFISFSAQGYVDTARRSELSSTASIVSEKITRLVREALPNSVRITSNSRCLEFMPVVSASQYVQAPIEGSPASVSRNELHVVPLDGLLNVTGYAAIYPMPNQQASLYSNSDNPGYLSLEPVTFDSTQSGASVYTFNNSLNFEYLQSSPSKRVFLTDRPVAFCQDGTRLFYYRNYGFVANVNNLVSQLPNAVPNRLLIADKLLANSLVFSYLPSGLRRNGIVAFELEFQDSTDANETLVVNQEVQIRNVP